MLLVGNKFIMVHYIDHIVFLYEIREGLGEERRKKMGEVWVGGKVRA